MKSFIPPEQKITETLQYFVENTEIISAVKTPAGQYMQKNSIDSEQKDIISLLAEFLNFRIKLYHAVLASIVIWILIIVFTQQSRPIREESQSAYHPSPLAASGNSTVLPSISTHCLKEKN